MLIYHIALDRDWRAAMLTGSYTVSTLGKSLDEVGFIHACRAEQLVGVTRLFYAKVRDPLVRVEIDTSKLAAEVREESVGDATFPHIYGPINVDSARSVVPWHPSGRQIQFLEVFLRQMMIRIGVALAIMLLAFALSAVGKAVDPEQGQLAGALAGLLLGGAAVTWWVRRK